MQEITVLESEHLTIKAKIATQVVNWEAKTMLFEAKITTITPVSTLVEGQLLEVSNQNKFPVWIDEDTPQLDENNEQVLIGEWDMWQLLKPHTLMSEAEEQIQNSLKRKFGLFEEPFKFILPKE